MKYYIEVMLHLNAGYKFQKLYTTFSSESEAHQYMDDARKVGWTWPDWAIVCVENA
jgi:hypothetical protein